MVSPLKKTAIRDIRASMGRFLAIFAITALGTGFFLGLSVCRDAMIGTLDEYVAEHRMFDLRIASTLGFTQEDAEELGRVPGVVSAQGALSQPFLFSCGDPDGESRAGILIAHSLTDGINTLSLTAGRIPERGDECVADAKLFSPADIGSVIRVTDENESDAIDAFATRQFTIVGIADSVLYLNYERGTASIGQGTINGFIFLPRDAFTGEIWHEVYLRGNLSGAVYSPLYSSSVSSLTDTVKPVAEALGEGRYESLRQEGEDAIADALCEYEAANTEYLAARADVEAQLLSSRAELLRGAEEASLARKKLVLGQRKLELSRNRQYYGLYQLNQKSAELEENRAAAYAALDQAEADLIARRGEAEHHLSALDAGASKAGFADGNALLAAYDGAVALQPSLDRLQVCYASRNALLAERETADEARVSEIDGLLASINSEIQTLEQATGATESTADAMAAAADGTISALREAAENYRALLTALSQIADGEIALETRRSETDAAFAGYDGELQAGRAALSQGDRQLADAQDEIDRGWIAVRNGARTLADGMSAYQDARRDAEDAFADAEEQLRDACTAIEDGREDLASIKAAEVYVLDRGSNTGYVCFDNDSLIVYNIARIFPLFFLLVAALVCMTTMTRMVDEQRTQIGVLKALGYSSRAILSRFLFYSGSATTLGCLTGFFGGSFLFPFIIWKAYGILYGFGEIRLLFDYPMGIAASAGSVALALLVTYLTCRSELVRVPAELLRPRAPKAGNRVLLERVTAVWKHLSFLQKVTVRNVARYKKRLVMMVIGISGCTALLVTGFGLNDSVSDIVRQQFGEVTTYDIAVSFTGGMDGAARDRFRSRFGDRTEGIEFMRQSSVDLVLRSGDKSAYLLVSESGNLDGYMSLTDGGQRVPPPGRGEALISRGIAENYGMDVGDTLLVRDADGNELRLTVSGVFNNHVYNYVLLSSGTYEDALSSPPEYNAAYINVAADGDAHALAADMASRSQVFGVTVSEDVRERVGNMLSSMKYIITLVVICAGALAFIVLYNLTNININERIREIATIKVLGFYQAETARYEFSENLLLTALGAAVGLLLGKALHAFVMGQIRIDMISFDIRVTGLSYCMSFVMTLVFAGIVCLCMMPKLRRVNMAESLKTIE